MASPDGCYGLEKSVITRHFTRWDEVFKALVEPEGLLSIIEREPDLITMAKGIWGYAARVVAYEKNSPL